MWLQFWFKLVERDDSPPSIYAVCLLSSIKAHVTKLKPLATKK